MRRTLLRFVAGCFAITSGVIWVAFAMLVGGKLFEQTQGNSFSYVAAALPLLAFLVSLGIAAFFALGILRFRYGPYSPRLFWACVVLGSATLLSVVVLLRGQSGL